MMVGGGGSTTVYRFGENHGTTIYSVTLARFTPSVSQECVCASVRACGSM